PVPLLKRVPHRDVAAHLRRQVPQLQAHCNRARHHRQPDDHSADAEGVAEASAGRSTIEGTMSRRKASYGWASSLVMRASSRKPTDVASRIAASVSAGTFSASPKLSACAS